MTLLIELVAVRPSVRPSVTHRRHIETVKQLTARSSLSSCWNSNGVTSNVGTKYTSYWKSLPFSTNHKTGYMYILLWRLEG